MITETESGEMMWDVLLYMRCFYWLMNKATLNYGRAEYSQAGGDRDTLRQSQGDAMLL